MLVTITLNSGLGANLGPLFSLSCDSGPVTPSTATKTELLAGKTVSLSDLATQVIVTSIGTCTTPLLLPITGIPTTTTTTTSTSTSTSTSTTSSTSTTTSTTTEPPTTTSTTTTTTTEPATTTTTTTSSSTTTTTVPPPAQFSLAYNNSSASQACTDYPTTNTSTYYASPGSTLQNNLTIYSDLGLTTAAINGFYSDGTNNWQIAGGLGVLNNEASCSATTSTTTTTTTEPITTTTTTSTSSTTSTSTSTTTLPPVQFNSTPSCVSGSGQILNDSYTGGNGSYVWIAIATSPANAISYVQGVGGSRFSAGSSYTFTGLADGTYYVALLDSIGNVGVTANPGITISCATTSTTTTTTSTSSTTTSSTTTTTTATPPAQFSLAYSNVSGSQACSDYPTTNTSTYYASPGSSLQPGLTIYSDVGLTTAAINGFYSDGTNFWTVAGGLGVINQQTSCSATTTTTTTTTTVPPVQFTSTPSCSGGQGQILANNYSGGSGSYVWIAIANSAANAISYVQGIGGSRFSAGTSYNFTSLADGTYYIALLDSNGNVGVTSVPGITIACATTTTTTSTTTTLPPPAQFSLSYDNSSSSTACTDYPTLNTSTYYASPGSTLQNNLTIYSDLGLTTAAINGFYSNGTNSWQISGGLGVLNNEASCSGTTTTTTTTTTTSTTTTTTTLACFEYVATASQTDLDNSDNGTVYFDYIDCNGNPQTEQRGTTTPGNPVCMSNTGSVYILIGGLPSAAGSSLWTATGIDCNGPILNLDTFSATGCLQEIGLTTTGTTTGTIDWGDGTIESVNLAVGPNTLSHTYVSAFAGNVSLTLTNYSVVTEFIGGSLWVISYQNLQKFTSLISFSSESSPISYVDLSGITPLEAIYFSKSSLTSVGITGCNLLNQVGLDGNLLTSAVQTQVLQQLYDSGVTNGYANLTSNSETLGAGGQSIAQDLINIRSWSVLYDTPP